MVVMEICLPGSIRYRPVQKWEGRVIRKSGWVRCGIAEPSGVPAPMGQKTQYKDGFFEKAFMSLFARKMEKFAAPGACTLMYVCVCVFSPSFFFQFLFLI